jgi:hypothetical protein
MQKGNAAGAKPKLSEPQPADARKALIRAGESWARSMQLEGESRRGMELLRKAMAAIVGTPHEKLLSTKPKQTKYLRDLHKGLDGLSSTKGESVVQRRVEYLTEGNVNRWMDGWEAFLVNASLARSSGPRS